MSAQLAPHFSAHHTLDVEHKKRVKAMRRERERELGELGSRPGAVDGRALSMMCDPDIAVRLEARLAAAAAAARGRPAARCELDYMLCAGPVLMRYYDRQADDQPACGGPRGGSILRYFLPDAARGERADGSKAALMKEYERATRAVVDDAADADAACPACGAAGAVVLVAAEALRVCTRCDACEPAVVETERPPSKDTVKDSTAFCYKRLNHFNEWLSQIQGKQQTHIPDDVYDAILLELKKRKTLNLTELTAAQVKDILKKLRFNKWYEHVTFILNRLSGRPTRALCPELQDTLRSMFRQIQTPFVKHSPSSRKNFLSYSYVLHKLVELLGQDEFLASFPLLKSRDKLQQQDKIWRCICVELRWEFIPSM